jgi:hypothetical protein
MQNACAGKSFRAASCDNDPSTGRPFRWDFHRGNKLRRFLPVIRGDPV